MIHITDFIRPDHPSKCTWLPNATSSPHSQKAELNDRKKVLPDILNAIGQTPMVRVNKIPRSLGVKCEILAKCEFFNPGGSVKDRIAYRMIQDAEEKGLLKPGYTIIEPTSGNTGIGLAMASAVRGYKCIIVMPEKMSNEKVYTLRALGAEIIRTPTEAAWDSPEAHINVAQKLQRKIPNSIILDQVGANGLPDVAYADHDLNGRNVFQYTNSGNPLAHYDQTAIEIWNQCEGRVDYVILSAGTGGTVTGIGRKLKELSPETKIVAVDPHGSILAPSADNEKDISFYEVEGIGYDFVPTVLDRGIVDRWVKTEDGESLNMARMLIREEGLLCGGSSGAAFVAALQVAKDLPMDKRVVVLLPDGIRNYMTKFVSDLWMEAKGFTESKCSIESNEWWWNLSVSKMHFGEMPVLTKGTSCQEAVHVFQNIKRDQLLIMTEDGIHVKGVVTAADLMNALISGKIKRTDAAEGTMTKQFTKIELSMTLGRLSRILEKDTFVVVVDHERDHACVGIMNQNDLFNYISNNDNESQSNDAI